MTTLWEKLSKANDAACAVFQAISNRDVDHDIDAVLGQLFDDLKEAKDWITPDPFVGKNDYAPQLMKELGPNNSSERSSKAVRYVARVNLATFTIAVWTGVGFSQALSGFFQYVIPKHYGYSNDLFETFVKISSRAACIAVNERVETEGDDADVTDILRLYLRPTPYELGVPELTEELEPLISMCHAKHRWVNSLVYLEDWMNEKTDGDIRTIWSNLCWDIMSHFDRLYPDSNVQTAKHLEPDHNNIVETWEDLEGNSQDAEFLEASARDESAQRELSKDGSPQEETQEVLLGEDFLGGSDELPEEESEGEANKEVKADPSEAGEPEVDELDEDEDDDAYKTPPTEALAPESTSKRRSSSAEVLLPPGEELKRSAGGDDETDDEDIPKIKRPRVLPASQQQTLFSSLETLDTLDDPPVPKPQPNQSIARDSELGTPSLLESQQTQPPEPHPFYATEETLPHGLPGTVNEGPASPIQDDDGFRDEDDQNDTTYREITQSTSPERSISVGAAPKRARRDLPFSTADRGPRALSPSGGAQAPSRSHRSGRKPYTPWSHEELEALEAGLEMFGASWSQIKTHFKSILAQRTNVQIKDKARTEYTAREKAGLQLGIYACISTPKFTGEQISQRTERTARNRQQKQEEQSGQE